jgi:hypothetical protein
LEEQLGQFKKNSARLRDLHQQFIRSTSKSEEQSKYLNQDFGHITFITELMPNIDRLAGETNRLAQDIRDQLQILKKQGQSPTPNAAIIKSQVRFIILIGTVSPLSSALRLLGNSWTCYRNINRYRCSFRMPNEIVPNGNISLLILKRRKMN